MSVAVSAELVLAVRALRLRGPPPSGAGVRGLYDAAAARLDPDMADRPLSGDLEAARQLLFEDALWMETEHLACRRDVGKVAPWRLSAWPPKPRPSPTESSQAVAAPDLVAAAAGAGRVRPPPVAHLRQPARRTRARSASPPTAAPQSPIAKGYKAVSIQDTRWQKVDDLLTWTRLGWEAREVIRKHSVPLGRGGRQVGGAPAFYDAKGNVCYLNLSSSPAEIRPIRARDVPRAPGEDGQLAGRRGLPQHGGAPQEVGGDDGRGGGRRHGKGFEHKRGLENRGLADKKRKPAGMGTYRRVFEHWRAQALAEGKDEVQPPPTSGGRRR